MTVGSTAVAGCSAVGGGGNPNTELPKPDMRADPEDLAYPAWGQTLPEVTLPAALTDDTVTTTQFDAPFVLTFIYTTCKTACPVLTQALVRAQQAAIEGGYGNDVQFAEISFDPARDTPEVIREFATERNVNLDAGNWRFLLPESESRTRAVVEETFGVAFEKTTPENMDQYMFTHSSLVLLVNSDNYVERAYNEQSAAMNRLSEDLETLATG